MDERMRKSEDGTGRPVDEGSGRERYVKAGLV